MLRYIFNWSGNCESSRAENKFNDLPLHREIAKINAHARAAEGGKDVITYH
jgi:hypothetical protein